MNITNNIITDNHTCVFIDSHKGMLVYCDYPSYAPPPWTVLDGGWREREVMLGPRPRNQKRALRSENVDRGGDGGGGGCDV